MEPNKFELTDIILMDRERIDAALDLAGDSTDATGESGVMVLTDKRIIYINGNGKRRNAKFAAISDIDAVEVEVEGEGTGAFIWAALAFLVAILLFFVINPSAGWPMAATASAAMVMMGVYLIADRLTAPGRPYVIFKAGSSQLRCNLKTGDVSTDTYAFINRLFQLKEENGPNRSRDFAPR